MLIAYPQTTDYSASLVQKDLEQDINILYNSIASSSSQKDYSSVYLDILNDSNGYSNTINTSNTTANFTGGNYSTEEITVSSNGLTDSENNSGTAKTGLKILVGGSDIVLSNINKWTNNEATKGYLTNSGLSVIATASFIGDSATFSTAQTLTAGTTYYVLTDKAGASYEPRRKPSVSYPISGSGFTFTAGRGSAGDYSNYAWAIQSLGIVTGFSDGVVETNVIAIDETPTYIQIFAHTEATGSASINYDVSFDNGVNWIEANDLNDKVEVTTASTSQMIIQFNLIDSATDSKAVIEDYGVMIYEN